MSLNTVSIFTAFLILGAQVVITNVNGNCMTSTFVHNNLTIRCQIDMFTSNVDIIDPSGDMVAKCYSQDVLPRCQSYHNNGTVKFNYSTKEIILTMTNTVFKPQSGYWTCLQEDKIEKTSVWIQTGVINPSEVQLIGKVIHDKEDNRTRIELMCFTCLEPRGNNAEFLKNQQSVDNIAYNLKSGKCSHINGQCQPNICNCLSDGKRFIRIFDVTDDEDGADFSCDMIFADKDKFTRYSIVAHIHYKNKVFTNLKPEIIMRQKGPDVTDDILTETNEMDLNNVTVCQITKDSVQPWKNIAIAAIIGNVALTVLLSCCYGYKNRTSNNNQVKKDTKRKQGGDTSDDETMLLVDGGHSKQDKEKGRGLYCEPCASQRRCKRSELVCLECNEYMCSDCKTSHKGMKRLKDHTFVNPLQIPENFLASLCCTIHGTSLHYFCNEHDLLCCVLCIDHEDCDKVCIEKAYPKIKDSPVYENCKDKIPDLLNTLKDIRQKYFEQEETAPQHIEKSIKNVEKMADFFDNVFSSSPTCIHFVVLHSSLQYLRGINTTNELKATKEEEDNKYQSQCAIVKRQAQNSTEQICIVKS